MVVRFLVNQSKSRNSNSSVSCSTDSNRDFAFFWIPLCLTVQIQIENLVWCAEAEEFQPQLPHFIRVGPNACQFFSGLSSSFSRQPPDKPPQKSWINHHFIFLIIYSCFCFYFPFIKQTVIRTQLGVPSFIFDQKQERKKPHRGYGHRDKTSKSSTRTCQVLHISFSFKVQGKDHQRKRVDCPYHLSFCEQVLVYMELATPRVFNQVLLLGVLVRYLMIRLARENKIDPGRGGQSFPRRAPKGCMQSHVPSFWQRCVLPRAQAHSRRTIDIPTKEDH